MAKTFIKLLLLNSYLYGTIGISESKKNVDDCQRCDILAKSFNYWLDKTSRGKYEGGNAAWEEAKLKSYSRSEIRLVEVQEGLCSELKKHQDYCYALAEEAETVLEKWWFLEDPNSADLYTWLCIETLQYCCPKNHFGSLCNLCPMDNNNEVCGGHGRCAGDGTRKGNGTCLCKSGYSGRLCEKCTKNYFSDISECKPCHKACSECTGYGQNACVTCETGWQMVSNVCVDVNECLKLSICKENEYCLNQDGSYECNKCDKSCTSCKGKGSSNCTSCDKSSVLWSGKCLNDALKSDILRDTLKRTLLYVGLLIITVYVRRHYSIMFSFAVVSIVAAYIYTSENESEFRVVDVYINLYLK